MQDAIFSKPFQPIESQKILKSIPVLLLLGDILGLILGLSSALWLRLGEPLRLSSPILYSFILLVLLGLYIADTYKPDVQIAGLRSPARIILSSIFVAGIGAALIYATGAWRNNPLLWRSILLPSLGMFTAWAVMLRLWAVSWMRSHAEQSRWLILAASQSSIKFVQDFLNLNQLGSLVALAEDTSTNIHFKNKNQDNRYFVANLAELSDWMSSPWSGILVGNSTELTEQQMQLLMSKRLSGTPVYKLSDFYESVWYKLPSSYLQDTWFIFSQGFNLLPGGFSSRIKRLIDTFAAALLLFILSPLMLAVAVAIKLDSPGNIFYSQVRTGMSGKPFRVYKFRSMYKDAEKRGVAQWASERDPRITRVGYWLRILRLDELPQFWNVIRGEMSLIGPRPERPEFDIKLKQEIPYYDLRYLVKPGITGWAQVMYPYGASIEDSYEKLAYDLYYIKNFSIWLDIAIFFKTIRVVILGKGR